MSIINSLISNKPAGFYMYSNPAIVSTPACHNNIHYNVSVKPVRL